MTGARLELANINDYATTRDYVEQHLAPAVTELHRITNELLSPGATSVEEWAMDMVPEVTGPIWKHLDTPLKQLGKHVVFEGSEYFTLPKDILKSKQVKVQFTATVYAYSEDKLGVVEFQLMDDDGHWVESSLISTDSVSPVTISKTLSFGEGAGCIKPEKRTYYILGRSLNRAVQAVCRRFSLSFLYL